MTTTVVAYTSFCDGHVTRFSSLRTSLRNKRMRSIRPPVASLTVSSVVGSAIFDLLLPHHQFHLDAVHLRSLRDLQRTTFAAAPPPSPNSPLAGGSEGWLASRSSLACHASEGWQARRES